jgi:hypothetical protein
MSSFTLLPSRLRGKRSVYAPAGEKHLLVFDTAENATSLASFDCQAESGPLLLAIP